jgi:RimJ/RimL family protein N-acetyltransferase
MTLLEREPTEGLQVGRKALLRTARLTLRAPRPDDAKSIKSLINDRRIAENMATVPHPYTLKDARSFIADAAGKPLFVIARDDGRLVGGGGIGLRPRGYEIGYWIGVRYWGNGYATEAARALVDHAFRDLDLTELLAGARVTNPASRRVLEKCGFQWTGVVLQRVAALNSSAPSDRFRLDRGLWESLRNWGKVERID